MSSVDYRSRIVGHGEEAPDQLLANPANWRIHPKAQQDALSDVLGEVGWVQSVIVNRTTGHLVDGHLRVSLALREDAATIPVSYVELSLEEEALVLATLDPLSTLAGTDKEKLNELLAEVSLNSVEVERLLGQLVASGDSFEANGENKYSAAVDVPQYKVVGERPTPAELFDETKTRALQADIRSAKLDPELEAYLLAAANRHTVFNYQKAAEYYPHATPEIQRLMEDSALVIVDFEDAIRNGFVKFTNSIADLREEDERAT